MFPDLPSDYIPHREWVIVTPEIRRSYFYPAIREAFQAAVRGPGWNPKTVQLGGKLLAIDYSGHPKGHRFYFDDEKPDYDSWGDRIDYTHPASYCVAVVDDHEFLSKLPSNAPRTVKHMFRKDIRMRWLRMTECFDFLEAAKRAEEGWDSYRSNLNRGKDNA